MQDHTFNTRTEAVDSTPAVSFFAGGSTASLLGPFRVHRAEAISERRRTTSSVTNVLHRNAFDEAKSGRCDVDPPLGVNKEDGVYPSGGKQSFASASRRLFRGQVRAVSTSNRVRNWCACRVAFAKGLHGAKARLLPPEYPAESHLDSKRDSKSNRKGI